jgi:hypothetical protein
MGKWYLEYYREWVINGRVYVTPLEATTERAAIDEAKSKWPTIVDDPNTGRGLSPQVVYRIELPDTH